MKTMVKKEATVKSGYVLVTVGDDGVEKERVEVKLCGYEKYPNTLALPKNASNRQWLDYRKVDAAPNGVYELTYKPTRTLGQRTAPKKVTDYLNEEDKKALQAILDRAKARKEQEKAKANDPIEKAKRRLERAKKILEELEAAQKATKKKQ